MKNQYLSVSFLITSLAVASSISLSVAMRAQNNPEAVMELINKGSLVAPSDEQATIEFQFEDADLGNLITQIEELFDIKFITDDAIFPLAPGAKSIKGNKITFRTQVPFTKHQALNLFITLLDISGFTVIPDANQKIFRIVAIPQAQRSPLPAYIGDDVKILPDSDQIVRYLYFVKNGSLENLTPIVDSLRSSASGYLVLKDLNAFLLTDKAYNIKSLISIINDLDQGTLPQSMSVLKLKRANAQDVKLLYDALIKADEKNPASRTFPTRRQATTQLFPDNARVIAEPRTNALIILGPQDAVKKIESFVLTHIDTELGAETRSPLHIYALKYADAKTIADLLSEVAQFGKNTPAGKIGGVRDGDKYLKTMSFTAEPITNRIIIRGDYDDFLQVKKVIEDLDQPQPQVSVEVLILTIDIANSKGLGAQIRSKTDSTTSLLGGHSGLTGPNVKFQTSGIDFGGGPSGFVTNNTGLGVQRLLGDLVTLAVGAGIGNTAITLGADAFGVWGIFNALNSITNTQVIANPFLTVANKQKALVEVGQQRRVISGNVISGGTSKDSFSDDTAAITVNVRPQINSDGMIILDLDIKIEEYTSPVQSDATKTSKQIRTVGVLADKEVLALGGLIRNKIGTASSKWPVLGNIPILGWLFKNKSKTQTKSNLLILISTQIIPVDAREAVTSLTRNRMNEYHTTLDNMNQITDTRDPVHRFFFKPESSTELALDSLIFERNEKALKKEQTQQPQKPKIESESTTMTANTTAKSGSWFKRRFFKKKANNREVITT
jgi:general secretion pathway protein D